VRSFTSVSTFYLLVIIKSYFLGLFFSVMTYTLVE